ncbi:predicted protein [Lichtheimia corymbifera JMRC:FSU:9682]|uniref:Uncharacterized protein n=1 Tax=Lichtheimia corymbifera JMRC:FSU:9682 TaxID=1263082 RepID=A0A068RFX2_9FUNG|nr:predicted protein [Lichtheimia corymbifera JMRC:FSU:9682]
MQISILLPFIPVTSQVDHVESVGIIIVIESSVATVVNIFIQDCKLVTVRALAPTSSIIHGGKLAFVKDSSRPIHAIQSIIMLNRIHAT